MAVAESGIGVGMQWREDRRRLVGGGRSVTDVAMPLTAVRVWRAVRAARGAAGP